MAAPVANCEEAAVLDRASQAVYNQLKARWAKEGDKDGPQPSEHMYLMHTIGYRKETNPSRFEYTWDKFSEVMGLRKKYDLDNILDQKWDGQMTEEEIFQIWPMFIYGRDPVGRPIVWDKAGCMDLTLAKKFFLANAEQKEMIKIFYLRFLEGINVVKNNIARDKGHPLYKQVCVYDMGGISILSINTAKDLMKDLIQMAQLMYPESLKKMYLINCGWFFRGCWAIIKIFVDKLTQQKICLVGGEWIKEMQKDGISLDQIPKSWGGQGQKPVIMGHDFIGMDFKIKTSDDNEEEKKES